MTVIIPTRERADVFASALRTVVAQDYVNLEILVSDNYSGDATEEIARSTSDPRVRYVNTGRRLSMSHNWEFALSQVTDGWVTIVGDDDGLLPGSLQAVADLIQMTGTLSVQSATCRYKWPGNKGRKYGRLRIPTKQGHEVRDSKIWMSRVLRGDAAYAELPMLYTGGYTSMDVLHELKRKTGVFYKSCVPDVYSGFAIASLIPNYAYSHVPFAIGGTSKHSIGVDHFSMGKKIQEAPSLKFSQEDNIPFHKDVPLTRNGEYPLLCKLRCLNPICRQRACGKMVRMSPANGSLRSYWPARHSAMNNSPPGEPTSPICITSITIEYDPAPASHVCARSLRPYL